MTGCTATAYYWQAARGEMHLLADARPIQNVIDDPATPTSTRAKLRLVGRTRRFASQALLLPDNGSYKKYVALHRPYVVWNVFATPEFSLAAVRHCFPIAGCVDYQGYFSHADALAAARRLAAAGDDTYVAGVPAFSTLGHFDDPVLSSMLRWDDDTLVATLFHELAHQKLYLPGDTAFNESFASFVADQGLRQWLAAQHRARPPDRRCARRRFDALIDQARAGLNRLYRQPLPAAMLRARKADQLAQLVLEVQALPDGENYRAWLTEGLNNAKLVPIALYRDEVPAFAALYAEVAGRWADFYAAVRTLTTLSADRRRARLTALAARAVDPPCR
ncbi:MAG: aminopeptidase [Gammaproteobacteria bacterium]|nr:aminopeptidase [Gammaproteobacteria bacterium]